MPNPSLKTQEISTDLNYLCSSIENFSRNLSSKSSYNICSFYYNSFISWGAFIISSFNSNTIISNINSGYSSSIKINSVKIIFTEIKNRFTVVVLSSATAWITERVGPYLIVVLITEFPTTSGCTFQTTLLLIETLIISLLICPFKITVESVSWMNLFRRSYLLLQDMD